MTSPTDEMLNTVERYKKLAENKENQAAMIKDSAIVQFLVYALEGTSVAVRDTAMTTLELFGDNVSICPTLRKTFGVMESLQAIAHSSVPENTVLADRARKLHNKLEQSNNLVWEVPKEVILRIPDLTPEDCSEIWQALASVRGVVSCQFNLELHTCTLTVFSSMNPESLVLTLSNQCGLEAEVVRPGFQNEGSHDKSIRDLPAYLPEEDSPIVQKKAVARRRPKRRESSWFTRAASVLVDSFFW